MPRSDMALLTTRIAHWQRDAPWRDVVHVNNKDKPYCDDEARSSNGTKQLATGSIVEGEGNTTVATSAENKLQYFIHNDVAENDNGASFEQEEINEKHWVQDVIVMKRVIDAMVHVNCMDKPHRDDEARSSKRTKQIDRGRQLEGEGNTIDATSVDNELWHVIDKHEVESTDGALFEEEDCKERQWVRDVFATKRLLSAMAKSWHVGTSGAR